MKKRTRFLSAALTLIMVIGLLPLSLFALGENEKVTEVSIEERSYESVSAALASKRFTTVLYEDFEAETVGAVAQSVLNTNTKDFKEHVDANNNVTYTGAGITTTKIISRYVSGDRNIQLKNYRQAFSIVQDSDQNKSLCLGNAALTAHTDHNDTFFDIMGAGVERGHDIFVSLDIKMGGKNIGSTVESLIDFINRDNGRFNAHAVWVSNVGGLYLDNSFSPETLIGYLSDSEYTNISVHVKLSENKYYVYVNDVLVNPEGRKFISVAQDGTYNNTGKTVSQYSLNQIRVYTTSENVKDATHAGIYYDNILLASRAQRDEHNTEYKKLFVTDFSDVKVGTGLTANEGISGISASAGIALSANANLPNKGYLSYANDGNDTVLKFGKPDGTVAVESEQIYFSLFGLAGYVRKNYSISIDFKMGAETLGNRYQIIHPKNRSTGTGVGIVAPTLETDGRIMCGSKQLGTASTEKYTRLTLDVVWSEGDVKLYYYVDGVHVHTGNPSATPWGDNEDAKYLNDISFVAGYGNSTINLKENELYVKGVEVSLTDGYNSGNNVSSPFGKKAVGFVENAGLTRFYNEDGSFKTEDFTVDGVKYLVGYNGIILGRETDGIEMSYADYFESTFAYGTDKNVKLGESLNASAINAGVSRYERAAHNAGATVGGKGVRYYVSYLNTKVSSQDSYYDFNANIPKNNETVVFDFDIMLDAYSGSNYGARGLVTTKGLDENGNRTTQDNDTILLEITSNGWLKSGDKYLVPLSKKEFTKISAVVTAPETGKNNGTFDIYVNGVLMIENAPLKSGMYGLQGFRNFQAHKQTVGMYLKNISVYKKADKPMQFRTMVNGEAVLTNDQTKTPVKAADLKKGVISENGIYRYYDSLGLPVINGDIVVDGKPLGTDANGKIGCGEINHLGTSENGICSSCGKKSDGISSIYGNSLSLGSDVKVLFYLDIEPTKRTGLYVEIGRESDYADENTVKIPLSDLETVRISDKNYYKVGYGVPAKDICDIIKVRIIRPDGTTGTEYTYSAKEYIDTVKAMETGITYTAELKALLNALEVYGSNASAVLDKLPENMITVPGTDIDWGKVTDASGSRSEDKIVKLNSFSLELKSNVKLRVYFSLTSGAVSINDFTFKVNGEKRNVITTSNKYVWCIEETVTAAELDESFTFTVESADSFLTLNLSALYYAKIMSEQAETEAEKNLMKAIYKYWEAAETYAKYYGSGNNSGAAEVQSALSGKTLYSFGDSLVAGHHSGNGMFDGLAKEYGMVYTKYAKNGATINMNVANGGIYAQVMSASNVCPDFIAFDGLTNDVGAQHVGLNYPIGAITEGFDKEFDTTTFCGSFEATVKLMKEKYPDAIIVFVTPHKMPTRHLEYFKQLVDLAMQMCEKWDIYVANVYYEGDIDTTVDAQRVVYSYNNQDESEGNGNGTHLTGVGYDIFYAPIICRTMAEATKDKATYDAIYGKTVYSFGDSLIDGTAKEGNGMLYNIVSEYGLNYTEYAFRGSAINIHNADQTKVVYNQLTAADSGSPDYIIFNGLTNDVSNITESSEIRLNMGTISDGFDAELDTTTFCGSFETILRLMKEKYPTAKIIYVTPHKMATKKAEGMRILVDAAIQICEKWGVTVADVYHRSGLDLTDEAMKTLYSVDGCHLTKLGYDTFYVPVIIEKMAELG